MCLPCAIPQIWRILSAYLLQYTWFFDCLYMIIYDFHFVGKRSDDDTYKMQWKIHQEKNCKNLPLQIDVL